MEVTTTEAVRHIWERHLVAQVEARRVLSAGLAGPGRRVGSSVRYDADALARLLDRPRCQETVLDDVRPLIARLGRDRDVHVDRGWDEVAEAVRGGWYLPRLMTLMLMAKSSLGPRRAPFVATIASWVVFGGEIVSARFETQQVETQQLETQQVGRPPDTRLPGNRSAPRRTFVIEPPGPWFDRIKDTWLPLERGPTLTLWGAPTLTDDGADPLAADYQEQVERMEQERMSRSSARARALFQETTPGLTTPAPPDEPPGPPRPPR